MQIYFQEMMQLNMGKYINNSRLADEIGNWEEVLNKYHPDC